MLSWISVRKPFVETILSAVTFIKKYIAFISDQEIKKKGKFTGKMSKTHFEALHTAAIKGDKDELKSVLKQGHFDVNGKDKVT